jgi:hypothetical protein
MQARRRKPKKNPNKFNKFNLLEMATSITETAYLKMVDAHGVELPGIRNHLDDALGIFLQRFAVVCVCEQAFEYVHPFTEPNLGPERAAQDRGDLRPQIDPLHAHKPEVHQLWKLFRDDLIQIGAVGDCEYAELTRSEVSVG